MKKRGWYQAGTARAVHELEHDLKKLFREALLKGLTVDDIGECVESTLQGQWEE